MSDEILAQYTTEPEWVKETEEEDLRRRLITRTDTYEAQLTDYKVREGLKDPFRGTHLVRLYLELFNVAGSATRMYFQDVCPEKILRDDGEQTIESKLWSQLVKATETIGKRASDTLAAARLIRLKVRVRFTPERDVEKDGIVRHYDARNWTDAISAVR